jgi:hypothetical protein
VFSDSTGETVAYVLSVPRTLNDLRPLKLSAWCLLPVLLFGCGGNAPTSAPPSQAGNVGAMPDATAPSPADTAPVVQTVPPDASPGAPPSIDTAPVQPVRQPINDDCYQPTLRCVSYLQLVDQMTVSKKDTDSFRGAIGTWCAKVVDDKTINTYFRLEKPCAYSETCEWKADGPPPACVSCGLAGLSTVKQTENGVLKTDCEGCHCRHVGSVCHAAANGAEAYVNTGYRSQVTGSGKLLPDGFPGYTVKLGAVRKMNVVPNGEYDFDLVVDITETDNFNRVTMRHVETRIAGNCQP